MFHTPPINNPKYDSSQSIKESYHIHLESTSPDLSNSSSNGSASLTKEEIAQEIGGINTLPAELSKLIDIFIDDLKQPKYLKPLNVLQLSGLFQAFYSKFDKASFQYLMRANDAGSTSFMSARESLSSGISGIFNRSRSGSDTRKRSSSLFSTDSSSGLQPLLTPEEINRHIRTTELNNLKVEKYMELCEHDVFRRILEVGTSVPGCNSKVDEKPQRTLKVSNLFRNSPEFIEFDKRLGEKLETLNRITSSGKLGLIEFLSITHADFDTDKLSEHLERLVYESIAPHEKLENVLKMHDDMIMSLNHLSNDDFLSTLIYLVIKKPVKSIFLNLQFIRLFRYSKKLVEKELYALTNLDAALTFVENLTLNDFPAGFGSDLSTEEQKELAIAISSKIALPDIQVGCETPSQRHPGLPRSNSYKEFEGLRTALDSSLRNIIGKIRSYTPPAPQPTTTTNSSQQASMVDGESNKKIVSIPQSVRELRNRDFEDLKVNELKQIFETYQKLLDAQDF